MTGEPVLLDLNEESDDEEQDFDAWEPDAVDADPSKAPLTCALTLCTGIIVLPLPMAILVSTFSIMAMGSYVVQSYSVTIAYGHLNLS